MMESKESKESMENVEEAQAVQDARAVIERIERVFTEREHVFVAIDGPCASGKTTLAALLQRRFDGNVLHMDDFFLRPEQRTPERSPNRAAMSIGNDSKKRCWLRSLPEISCSIVLGIAIPAILRLRIVSNLLV